MTMYLIRILLLGIIFSACSSFGQNNRMVIAFLPVFNHQPLVLEDVFYKWNNSDSIRISGFKFYVSGIGLAQDGRLQFSEANSFHLIDAATPSSSFVHLEIPEGVVYNQLIFFIGIDSITNTSGAKGGDLDPTNGMYWTWQSGYINVKVEGQSNLCKTRRNEFDFHFGGYAAPFPTIRKKVLDVLQSDSLCLEADLSKFIGGIELATQQSIMSPGKEAVALSELFIKTFAIKPK